MNILVTGGFGVNGIWVVSQLVNEGHRPIVYENRLDTSGIQDIIDKIDIVIGDISDLRTVIQALKEYRIKRLLHLAALMPDTAEKNPFMGFQINAFGTLNILEAARIIERVVFTRAKAVVLSATGEYGYAIYNPIDESYPTWPPPGYTVYGGGKDCK